MTEIAALDAIRQQLISRGDGSVWIDDWRDRYGWVAPTPKDLMLRHPDKFTLSFVGKKYTVTLVQGATWKQSKGSGGKGAPRTVPRKVPQAGSGAALALPSPWSSASASPGKAGWAGKGGKAGKAGKAGKGATPAPAALALPAKQGTEEDAIKEIKKQLAKSKDGYVWVNDWRRRFGSLAATQKEFLETHPDYFFLSFEGKRYSVEYVGPDIAEEEAPAPQRVPARKRPAESANEGWRAKAAKTEEANQGTEEEAIEEFVKQLRDPKNKEGKVWIPGFGRRFGHLGVSPKELLECHPEYFTVVAGKGNSYTVRLAEDVPEEAPEEAPEELPEEPPEEAKEEALEDDDDGFDEEV